MKFFEIFVLPRYSLMEYSHATPFWKALDIFYRFVLFLSIYHENRKILVTTTLICAAAAAATATVDANYSDGEIADQLSQVSSCQLPIFK